MGTPPAALWENTLSHVDALACGILLSSTSFRCPRRAGLIAVGTALWLAGGLLVPARIGVVVAYPLIGLGAAAFVLAALGVEGTVMRRPPLVYLGRVSYGLYVIHLPVLMAVRQALGSGAWLLCLFLALAITIGAAAISYRWLESPSSDSKTIRTTALAPGINGSSVRVSTNCEQSNEGSCSCYQILHRRLRLHGHMVAVNEIPCPSYFSLGVLRAGGQSSMAQSCYS